MKRDFNIDAAKKLVALYRSIKAIDLYNTSIASAPSILNEGINIWGGVTMRKLTGFSNSDKCILCVAAVKSFDKYSKEYNKIIEDFIIKNQDVKPDADLYCIVRSYLKCINCVHSIDKIVDIPVSVVDIDHHYYCVDDSYSRIYSAKSAEETIAAIRARADEIENKISMIESK